MDVVHDVTVDPTHRLIAGSKVSGTAVYNLTGEKLGSVEDVMIDKATGRIAYAVLSFGSFLGIGGQHHPLPWQTLTYDTAMGGYVVNLDRSVLEGAPVLTEGAEDPWSDPAFDEQVHSYYKASPYWGIMP